MVGVPGKSKGCHTCRRRKIKCDEGKPHCQRCLTTGRECEGYAKTPVFINRNAKGMMRRGHLEEAIRPNEGTLHTGSSEQGKMRFDKAPDPRLHIRISDRNLIASGLEGHLVSRYVPAWSRSSIGPDLMGNWFVQALSLPERGEALGHALAAMTALQAGWDNKDLSLVAAARRSYGMALRSAQKAIQDSTLAKDDRTLAAIAFLRSYEGHDTTSNSVKTYDTHVEGMIHLVRHRGPSGWSSPLSKLLLSETRRNAYTLSLQRRKPSPLEGSEWSPEIWTDTVDVNHGLADCGFALARAAGDIDRMYDGTLPLSAAPRVLSRAYAARKKLLAWHSSVIKHATFSWSWPDPHVVPTVLSNKRGKIHFYYLHQRVLMTEFWAIMIGINFIVQMAKAKVSPEDLELSEGPEEETIHPLQYPENIAEVAPLCVTDAAGIYSARRMIFPVRCGLAPVSLIRGERAAACKAKLDAVMDYLNDVCGVKFSRLIASASGRWIEPGLQDGLNQQAADMQPKQRTLPIHSPKRPS